MYDNPFILNKAKNFRDRHSLRMMIGEEYVQYPLCLENEEFGKYSIGVQMYFNFLKSSSLIFTFMALISIISMVSNLYGNGVLFYLIFFLFLFFIFVF